MLSKAMLMLKNEKSPEENGMILDTVRPTSGMGYDHM